MTIATYFPPPKSQETASLPQTSNSSRSKGQSLSSHSCELAVFASYAFLGFVFLLHYPGDNVHFSNVWNIHVWVASDATE